MNAQIKLTEGWKISNIENYPTKWALKSTADDERTTRATSSVVTKSLYLLPLYVYQYVEKQ